MSKERVVFTCQCGGAHYFEVWQWSDENDWSICFVERPNGFRQRLSSAWKALRGQDIFHGELYPDDYRKFAEAITRLAHPTPINNNTKGLEK